MNTQLQALCAELTNDIKRVYEESITLDEAEKLAAKFLYGQIQVAEALKIQDLSTRMRKSGVKAVKSAVRLEEVKKHEKKPTEGALEDAVNLNELVSGEQNAFDEAEVDKESLENYLSIFKDAHIYFRGVSKGRFE